MLEELAEGWLMRLKMRIFLGVCILFIASTVASCNEVRYFVWGRTTSAKLESMHGGRNSFTVNYSFTDGDLGLRKEDDDPSPDLLRNNTTVMPGDGTILIQYIPGTLERSRVKGHNYAWLTIPLIASGVLAAVFGVRFWIEFKDHERRSKAASALYAR